MLLPEKHFGLCEIFVITYLQVKNACLLEGGGGGDRVTVVNPKKVLYTYIYMYGTVQDTYFLGINIWLCCYTC